jgi:hypothetical protein
VRAFALVFVAPIVVAVGLLSSACQDPCVVLAERICNCEPTPSDRRNCRTDRITNRQSQVQIDDADRTFCEAKLETCECTDIDENRLEQCGFVLEPAE